MITQKIKHYRLSFSRTFPTTHPKAGEPTYFVEKINNAIGDTESCNVVVHTRNGVLDIWHKIHTCRGNYARWAKIMSEVQAGRAVIDLYYWDGKPYGKGVKQVVFATLDKNSRCGVQKLEFYGSFFNTNWVVGQSQLPDQLLSTISKNDGLSLEDFKAWFKGADLSEPMAIIHFTPFRY